ncbi:hypothetical protein B0T09DRAFT_37348 [Sordaria sp. MPI-SDFR-AT-0083]|nr:hypothetical protein B0T09DRAFT_37348 [Sordaria sp. MPI-SDFR-AT-0083]
MYNLITHGYFLCSGLRFKQYSYPLSETSDPQYNTLISQSPVLPSHGSWNELMTSEQTRYGPPLFLLFSSCFPSGVSSSGFLSLDCNFLEICHRTNNRPSSACFVSSGSPVTTTSLCFLFPWQKHLISLINSLAEMTRTKIRYEIERGGLGGKNRERDGSGNMIGWNGGFSFISFILLGWGRDGSYLGNENVKQPTSQLRKTTIHRRETEYSSTTVCAARRVALRCGEQDLLRITERNMGEKRHGENGEQSITIGVGRENKG